LRHGCFEVLDDSINVGCVNRRSGSWTSHADGVDAVKGFADLALRRLEFRKCDVRHPLRSSSEWIALAGAPGIRARSMRYWEEVTNGRIDFNVNARGMPERTVHKWPKSVVRDE
jgi:hypothetical protein